MGDLQAMLIDDRGNAVSEEVQPFYLADNTGLLQKDKSTEFEIGVQEGARDRNPLFLHFRWKDDLAFAPREHTSDVRVPTD